MSLHLIPDRLKKVREELGITMAEASRRLNLSKIGYCRYEYGDRTPSPQTVEVIAQKFNTSVDFLVGLTDDSKPKQYVVDREKSPELFELIEICQKKDNSEQIKRLIEYYRMLTDQGRELQ